MRRVSWGSGSRIDTPPPTRSVTYTRPCASTNRSLLCGASWPGGALGTQWATSRGCEGLSRSYTRTPALKYVAKANRSLR